MKYWPLLFCAAACARADVVLQLGSAISTPGAQFIVPLNIVSSGAQAYGIQWAFQPPTGITVVSVAPGPSGKAVTCDAASTHCSVGLSADPIPDGKIAQVTFAITSSYTQAIASIQVTSVSASDANGTALPASGSPGGAWVQGPSAPLARSPCANIVGPGTISRSYVLIVTPIVAGGVTIPAQICALMDPTWRVDTSTIPATMRAPAGSGANCVGHTHLSGSIDGANVVFTLVAPPNPIDSLDLYRNGLLQDPALDFSLVGAIVTFAAASTPQVGDTISARLCK